MKKKQMKLTTNLLKLAILCTFVFGFMNSGMVVNAAKKPLVGVTYHDDYTDYHRLYVGMQWSPEVTYEYGEKDGENNVYMSESAGTLTGVTFTSSNKKVATVDKKGIVKAKKAGTTEIKIASEELNTTIKIKVLPIKKVNTKKLVKEIKRNSIEFDWPLITSYKKNAKDVKKGYVKANKKYDFSMYSIRKYKQSNGKYRYVFAYQVLDKKGNPIKGTQKIEVPVEQIMVIWGLCSNHDSVGCVADAVKMGHCSLGWQTREYPSTESALKEARTYARENIYTSEDDFYSATKKYGWRNMCFN